LRSINESFAQALIEQAKEIPFEQSESVETPDEANGNVVEQEDLPVDQTDGMTSVDENNGPIDVEQQNADESEDS
jgi:hypothetical protein